MKWLIALTTVLLSVPAFAHHLLAGQEMTTFWHGMLSGVGHPLLEFDHLFFVALVGIASVFTGRAMSAPAGYIAAMLLGCVLMVSGVELPAIEIVIGLSLLVLGYIVAKGQSLNFSVALALFSLAGVFHGSAFGETMAAAEAGSTMPVLLGYLLGLGVLQYGVCVATGQIAMKVWKVSEAGAIQARLSGALAAGVGIFLTLENTESAAFATSGLG